MIAVGGAGDVAGMSASDDNALNNPLPLPFELERFNAGVGDDTPLLAAAGVGSATAAALAAEVVAAGEVNRLAMPGLLLERPTDAEPEDAALRRGGASGTLDDAGALLVAATGKAVALFPAAAATLATCETPENFTHEVLRSGRGKKRELPLSCAVHACIDEGITC